MIRNFIAGQWIDSLGQHSVPVINPATEEILGHTPMGTSQDVDHAVQAAHKAFLTWRRTPAIERIQYLFALKALMEADQEALAQQITLEHGKTLSESRGSVRRAIQMVETATSIPTLMMGQNFEDIASGIDCSTVRRPMGVFAGIAPFNFPAMVPFWFWPFAIACGNTYVLKASERVPLTFLRIGELLQKVGLPAGVFNLVHGGKEVVDALCTHPLVKGVSFVGSTPVAKHVYTLACSHGKRAQALGGAKNVMVALPDCLHPSLKERSLKTAVESIIGCAGERCLAGSLILSVTQETYDAFAQGTVSLAQQTRVGPGIDPATHMGPLISQAAKTRVSHMIEAAVQQGAQLLWDGRQTPAHLKKGYFLSPTVLGGIQPHMDIAQEEVFGPVILLGLVPLLDAAIQWINRIPYANTTTLFTASGASARKFAYEVDPSMIGINIGVPAPMAFFSFGGSKQSFFGDVKAHGCAAIEFFTDTYTTISRWYDDGCIW